MDSTVVLRPDPRRVSDVFEAPDLGRPDVALSADERTFFMEHGFLVKRRLVSEDLLVPAGLFTAVAAPALFLVGLVIFLGLVAWALPTLWGGRAASGVVRSTEGVAAEHRRRSTDPGSLICLSENSRRFCATLILCSFDEKTQWQISP